jgi:hypothetical protein
VSAPGLLYRGRVAHARLRPAAHRFSYKVFTLLLDIDRLDEVDRLTPLLSVGRFNLLGFHPDDHGARGALPLRAHVEALLAAEGVDLAGGRIRLLCYPRVLGIGFNPLSVYYAEDRTGRLVGIVHEVRNTFGERHDYVLPVRPGELMGDRLRQTAAKRFRVSPFLGTTGTYRFRLVLPGERIGISIVEDDGAGPILAASFLGERRPLGTAAVLAACLAAPLLTWKVIAAIRFEALRLWWKGVAWRRRPAFPEPDGPAPEIR